MKGNMPTKNEWGVIEEIRTTGDFDEIPMDKRSYK